MRALVVTLMLVLLTAAGALARDFNIAACTSDNRVALLTVDIQEDASQDIQAEIKAAFVKTAQALTAEALVSGDGFRQFVENLSEEDYEAIRGVNGPPVIGESCPA